jgi:hypothetical protein
MSLLYAIPVAASRSISPYVVNNHHRNRSSWPSSALQCVSFTPGRHRPCSACLLRPSCSACLLRPQCVSFTPFAPFTPCSACLLRPVYALQCVSFTPAESACLLRLVFYAFTPAECVSFTPLRPAVRVFYALSFTPLRLQSACLLRPFTPVFYALLRL